MLLIISPITSNAINILGFSFGFYSSILSLLQSFNKALLVFPISKWISFLNINKFYQNTRWFIRLSNVIVFQKPEPSILSILYGWSRIWDQFGLCLIVFFPVTSTKLISSYTYRLECQDIDWIFFFTNFLTFFCFNVRI